MALNFPAALRINAEVQGSQNLSALARSLQSLSATSKVAGRDLDKIYNETRKLSQAAGNSISSINNQIKALQALRNEAVIGSRQFNFYTQQLKGLEAQMAKLDGAGGGGGGGGIAAMVGSLRGLAGLAVAGGVTQVIRGISEAGMDAETARVRLKALTDVYGEYAQAQQGAARVASTLRLSTTEATDGFAKLYAGLRPTGVGLKEIETIMVGFGAAARSSGATAQETASAMIQLKQSLVAGRAQGDELRSILENAPALGQAVAEQMTKLGTFGKVTRMQLKELGSDGKISTDILIEALKQLGETELPKLQGQFNTGRQALTDLGNATNKLQVALSDAFGPIAVGLIKGFADIVNKAADAMERFNKSRQDRGQEIAINEQAMRNAMKRTYGNENMGGLISFLNPDFRKNFEEERAKLAAEAAKNKPQTGPNADQLRAQQEAEQEREAARDAARRQAMEDELKIRRDAEDRLADAAENHARELAEFRKQTARQAADMERDLGDQRLQMERNIAEARRRVAATERDMALESEKQRRAALGLSTEAIDFQKQLNEQTRRFTEENIKIEQQASDRNRDLARKLEEFKLQVSDGIGRIQEGYARKVSDILQDAGRKLAASMEKGASNAAATLASGSPGAGGSGTSSNSYYQPGVGYFDRNTGKFLGKASTGQYIQGGIGPGGSNDYGPHFDIKRSDGGYYPRNALDDYVRVNGMPLSKGVTVPGGEYGAPRSYGPHAGWDYAFAGRAALTLTGGAQWTGSKPGSYGDEAAFMTPDGKVYKIIHGTFQGSVGAGASTAAAAAASPAPGSYSSEAAGIISNLTGAVDATKAKSDADKRVQQEANINQLISERQASLTQATSQLDQQNKSVGDQLRDQIRINDLIRSGINPEVAKARVEAENAARLEYNKLGILRDQLTLDLQGNTLTEEQRIKVEKILAATILRQQAQKGIVDGVAQETVKLQQLTEAQQRAQALASGIAGAIGNGLGSAMDLLINGTENWGNSLRQIGATILKDIARQITQIMVIQPIVKGITGGLNSLFKFEDGGIMTAAGPVPLRKYASGGIANSPQLALYGEGSRPEAYVPLPDGRRIPVAMKGGGGGAANVTVNVDASGGSQVAGNPGQAQALGRAVSQAVQNEILRQKRPGGLLAA